MNTLGDAKASARGILGDTKKSWMTDAYLNPIAQHCYELIILDLSEVCSPYIEKVAVVPNIQPGTTDLSEQQSDQNHPLYGLMTVLHEGVDWKLHGSPDTSYRPARQVSKLPDLPPRTIPIDLRVRGEFIPPPLIKETDVCQIHPMMSTALAEQLAAAASRERVNPGQMQSFTLVASDALDDIKDQLMRADQGTPITLGRLSGGNNSGYGYGYGAYYLNSTPGLPGGVCFEWRAYKLYITP